MNPKPNHPMASVKETIEAAKNAAKAKVHQLMQSNAEKIAELTDQFKGIQKQIAARVESKKDMEAELKAGEVPENMRGLAKQNISSMREQIDEKVKEADQVLKKMEKLGAKDEAKVMKEAVDNMVHGANARRGIGH